MLTFGNRVNYPKDSWNLRAVTVQVEGSRMTQQGFQSTSPCSCTHLLPKNQKGAQDPVSCCSPGCSYSFHSQFQVTWGDCLGLALQQDLSEALLTGGSLLLCRAFLQSAPWPE